MPSLFLAFFSLLVSSTLALPTSTSRRFSARHNDRLSKLNTAKRAVEGTIGLGDNADLLYTVPIQLGDTTTIVNLDTGSSDLWAKTASVPSAGLNTTGAQVTMRYGDSTTGTFASGPIAVDTVSIAGVAIDNQMFAAISDTTNSVVEFGAAGIFGLGFPSGSQIQGAAVTHQFGSTTATDHFVASSYADGPLISRIAQSGALEMPMFTISLQRSTIDISGTGALTLGTLPDGVDNSSITWVPVRLYSPEDGGINPPSFAPNEASPIYPLRWEIDLDAVFLDGQQLAASTIPTTGGVDATRMSALIDTGNSILRGPSDVVSNILSTISPAYDPTVANSATLACAKAHNLTFQIGGKMFPIDPRDLIAPVSTDNAQNCAVDSIVATDAPGLGALFRWSLGDPFLKSNLAAFHYGNLTHPSQDPPRIGFMSLVPANAADLLAQAVQEAVQDNGEFDSTLVVAPTAAAELEAQVTVFATSASAQAADLTGTHAPAAPTPNPPAATAPVPTAKQGPATTGAPSNASGDKPKSAAARSMGVRDPWLLALGAAVLSAVIL
ncbi:aspartic peptidase domain-containing protein [Mycena rosella]|uniref:Aspartic peptidase domain-containing protein n=1 Tax=Mycena rosella TaxID=1033263 RepID=A0AAD7DM42_MYCRO|nr:aspartic peptidase domain-containing protein [Mycena rosella]